MWTRSELQWSHRSPRQKWWSSNKPSQSCIWIYVLLSGGFKIITCTFHPIWGNDPIWRAYFEKWVETTKLSIDVSNFLRCESHLTFFEDGQWGTQHLAAIPSDRNHWKSWSNLTYSQLLQDNSQELDWCYIRIWCLICSMHILQVTRLAPASFF